MIMTVFLSTSLRHIHKQLQGSQFPGASFSLRSHPPQASSLHPMPSVPPHAYVTHAPPPPLTYAPPVPVPAQQSQNWFVDSGTSHHITPDATNIIDPMPSSRDDHVFLGNRQGLPIHLSGSATFSSSHDPHISLQLKHLLHVPALIKTL